MTLEYQTKLFGLNQYFKEFSNLYLSNRLPNKIILSGKKGIGKSTLALHLINFIFSENEKLSYDINSNSININNKSYMLVQNYTHPNLFYINKLSDKKQIEISQIRNLSNFVNTSSFNNSLKIILIDDSELLTINASNSLLKLVEEPNINVQFIIIHDNSKFILDTLKSRCINFKINLKNIHIDKIVNNYFGRDVYNSLPNYIKNKYLTPSKFIDLINFCIENKIDLQKETLNKFLTNLIKKNIYKSKFFHIEFFKEFMEIYFLTKANSLNINKNFKLFKYFTKRLNDTIKYNLDIDSFFMEFHIHLNNEE